MAAWRSGRSWKAASRLFVSNVMPILMFGDHRLSSCLFDVDKERRADAILGSAETSGAFRVKDEEGNVVGNAESGELERAAAEAEQAAVDEEDEEEEDYDPGSEGESEGSGSSSEEDSDAEGGGEGEEPGDDDEAEDEL